MTIPKLICFDLGGVLIRCANETRRELLKLALPNQVAALEDLGRDNFLLDQRNFSCSERYQRGLISTGEFLDQYARAFEGMVPLDEIKRCIMCGIQGDFEEIAELLPRLSRMTRLACFSNTHALHWEHIVETCAWMQHFEIQLASHLCGHAKPSPEAFQHLCKLAGVEPEECLLVDDRAVNIEGAKQFGLRTIHYSNRTQLFDDLKLSGIDLTPGRPMDS